MAHIRIANQMQWTTELTSILTAAGHEVNGEHASLAFVDSSEPVVGLDDAPAIVVAAQDRIQQAIEQVRGGAFWFVRYPFVPEEVTLLVERALEYRSLLQGRQVHVERMEPVEASSNGENSVAAARNLAGKPLADIEKQVILSRLEQFRGHRVKTATALGIGVRTLGMKLKRWREEGEPIIGRSHRAMQNT